jgi:hypothetical protein
MSLRIWGLLEHRDHPHLAHWYASIRELPAASGALDIPLS